MSIDGRNIQEYTLSSLRANIAPVLQDTFLFNGTVADNIRYANPSATDEQVVDAAKAARIHSDIPGHADGYATKVGERGMAPVRRSETAYRHSQSNPARRAHHYSGRSNRVG